MDFEIDVIDFNSIIQQLSGIDNGISHFGDFVWRNNIKTLITLNIRAFISDSFSLNRLKKLPKGFKSY